MKLKSIKNIKGYKSFQDFTWQPFLNNETFHDEVNIFYGENGSGKSSVCNILKNVLNGDDLFNKNFGYKSFGKHKPQEASLIFDCDECTYVRKEFGDAGAMSQENIQRAFIGNFWDKKLSSNDAILFFDREFVAKNVHEYERKTTKDGQEQQSGKLIIEFDSEAINLRVARDNAKRLKEEQEQRLKDFNFANKESLAFSLGDDEKIFYQSYKNKDEEEVKKTKEILSKEKKEAENNIETDQIRQKKSVSIQDDIKSLSVRESNFSLSDYKTYQAIFNFDLKEQVKIETEQEFIDKVKTHKTFFEAGFEIRKTHQNQCPFCQSRNEEVGIKKIVDLYEQIYDTTYKAQVRQFKKDKQVLLDEILQITQTLSDFELDTFFLELKKLDQNYKIPNIYSVEDEKIYKKPVIKEIAELSSKISNLAKPNKENIQELYTKVKSEYEGIEEFIKAITDFIDQKNELIAKFKSDNTDEKLQLRITSGSKRIAEIDKELSFINDNKIAKQQKKDEVEKEQKTIQDVFVKLKTECEIALKDYEDHCSTKAFSNLLSKIQDYFKNFNFNFKLELKTDPTGNKTEFPFAFKVLDFEGNERDFKEGLSEGEIQVLSLCFFFAFLDIQKDKEQKILVFDDPITSLDNSNLSSLVDLIAEEQQNFSQTFVFTHHRTFFKFLRKRFDKHCHEYNLIRNKKEFGGSFICKSKTDKFLEKLKNFENDLAKIPPASLDVELKVVEYGQYLRYEVERYIKNTLLHWDADQNFALAIDGVKRNKLVSDDDLNKIKGVYSFCNWTTSHVDVGDDNGLSQLKNKINEFVAIVAK